MTEIPKILTLDQIKKNYQPRNEEFPLDNGGIAEALVSRNSEGEIVYVVPRSTKWIKEPPQKRGREPTV